MKEIFYLGFYNAHLPSSRKDVGFNPAGTMKMNYVISVLKKLNYKVTVISITYDNSCGFHKQEIVRVDDNLSIVFIPYFALRVFNKTVGKVRTSIGCLERYLKQKLSSKSVLISYHALEYKKMLDSLHQRIGFKWISEVEEIYCLSRIKKGNDKRLTKEIGYFKNSDAFLFVNDYLAKKYSHGKSYAVSYGNFVFHGKKSNKKEPPIINIAYTGIINEERGAFLMVDAMRLLPDNYRLNVLGFGSTDNINSFIKKMNKMNAELGFKKIGFYGTKLGNDYSNFLSRNDIGISLIDTVSKDVSNNSFPSKIIVYLSHGLRVVSTDCESIKMSKIANLLYYCDNSPESIAQAIINVDLNSETHYEQVFKDINGEFEKDLLTVIEG